MESVYQHCRNKIGITVWLFGKKIKMFRQVLTSSTQPRIWSFHVVIRKRKAKKCTKMQNARAGREELLFLLIKPIVLWRSRSRSRLSCVISLMMMKTMMMSTTTTMTMIMMTVMMMKLINCTLETKKDIQGSCTNDDDMTRRLCVFRTVS